MSARLFIRNDDVWTLDQEFRYFYDLAFGLGLPVIHAVIPGKMAQDLVRFLCRAKEKTPQLLDIVQHGWVHANHSVETGVKYEFGPSRAIEAQREDIKRGMKKMREAFGELFTPAFVPPYHGYDEHTLKILHEEGFRIFSAGTRRADKDKRFIEIPAQVSFTEYKPDQKRVLTAREMIANLAKGVKRRPLLGVLTHHSDFTAPADRKELARFFNYIAALKAKEGWRVLLFSEILSASKKELNVL